MRLNKPEILLKEGIHRYYVDVNFLDLNAGIHVSNHMFAAYLTEAVSRLLAQFNMKLGASGLIIDFVYPYTKSNRLSSAA
ncbi:MAG: hypothetical protein ACO2ZM_09655 [Francisellaceae bacterium]